MSKLRPLQQRKVLKILQKNGFKIIRSRKHITLKKFEKDKVLTTWVPKSSPITVFVLEYIIKQTLKPREDFC